MESGRSHSPVAVERPRVMALCACANERAKGAPNLPFRLQPNLCVQRTCVKQRRALLATCSRTADAVRYCYRPEDRFTAVRSRCRTSAFGRDLPVDRCALLPRRRINPTLALPPPPGAVIDSRFWRRMSTQMVYPKSSNLKIREKGLGLFATWLNPKHQLVIELSPSS